MRKTQSEGLEEAPCEEGEMVGDFIHMALWKEMKVIVKQRIGQILQVKEEEGVMFPSTHLQLIGPLQHQPHQKTDSSQTGAVLDQDLHL